MGRFIRTTLLPLLLVSILMLSLSAGCSTEKSGTSGGLTQAELEDLLASSMLSISQVESYGMRADMDMFMDISGGPKAGTMDMDMTMEGSIDQTNMEMYIVMEMSMFADMAGMGEEVQDMAMEMYMVDDYLYMKMAIPGMGEEWMKMPATNASMEEFNFDLVGDQLALLESYGEMEYLRDENLDGSDCYVIQMLPDLAAIMDWIGDQGLADLGLDWDDLDIIDDMFDEISYIVWIDKDEKYIKKMTAYMLMKMSGEDFSDLGADFDEMTMDISMDMEIYDYNEPVNVVLPAEAENAMDMGGGFGF